MCHFEKQDWTLNGELVKIPKIGHHWTSGWTAGHTAWPWRALVFIGARWLAHAGRFEGQTDWLRASTGIVYAATHIAQCHRQMGLLCSTARLGGSSKSFVQVGPPACIARRRDSGPARLKYSQQTDAEFWSSHFNTTLL